MLGGALRSRWSYSGSTETLAVAAPLEMLGTAVDVRLGYSVAQVLNIVNQILPRRIHNESNCCGPYTGSELEEQK